MLLDFKKDTNELIGTRKESPLVVGISIRSTLLHLMLRLSQIHTRNIIYLENGDLVHFKDGNYKIYDENDISQKK